MKGKGFSWVSMLNVVDIGSIRVHWSETEIVNEELSLPEDDSGIDVSIERMEGLILKAKDEKSKSQFPSNYDKQCLTITMKDGSVWAKESKFYLGLDTEGLSGLLNQP